MHRYLIFHVIFLGSINSLNAQDTFTFGACEPGKESCQECYHTLVKELLGNDGNVFNLSYVFTSPVRDEPSIVVVNYHFRFDNGTPDKVHKWFWAQSGAYILHPLFIFQFISLFFGNPKPIYEQVVDVTLNATECYGVQDNSEYMILLTQRLDVHLDEQKINPRIPDSYSAVAVNNETLNQVINNISDSTLHVNRKDVLIANPILALSGTMFVMITVIIIYGSGCCGGNIKKRRYIGLSTRAKATIISVSYISVGRIMIFILLDIGAMVVRELHVDPQVQSIYHEGNLGDLNDIVYNIPVTLLVLDSIALLFGVLVVIIALCFASTCKCSRCCIHGRCCTHVYTYCTLCTRRWCKTWYKDWCYYPLVLTVVPLIFSTYSHAPYIIMAYISDASFASSIFIYYVIAIFVEFGVLEYTFSTLFKKCKKWKILIFILALVLSVFINGIMTSIFTFFFFVPIKYALRKAPSEVLVIYQSAIILVGGYITYKAVFKDKHSQQEKLNSDITLLEGEIASLKSAGCCSATNVEACTAAMDKEPDIVNRRKRIAYLRNEMALASLKQKIYQCQSEGVSQTEVVHLRNKICRLGGEITDYLEDELKQLGDLEGDNVYDSQIEYDRDEAAFISDKIYHINLEIIEQLQQKLFDAWCSDKPCSDSWVVGLRKEMSVKVKRVFTFFPDHPDGIKSLYKGLYVMDTGIHIGESSLRMEFTDIQNGENIVFMKGEIVHHERKLEVSYDAKSSAKHRAKIATLCCKVVDVIEERIRYQEKHKLQEPMPPFVSETYSLKRDLIEMLTKAISIREERIMHVPQHEQTSKECRKLKEELDPLRLKIVDKILEKIQHQEQMLEDPRGPESDQQKLLAAFKSLKLEDIKELDEQEPTALFKSQVRSTVVSLIIDKLKRDLTARAAATSEIIKDQIDTLRSTVVRVFEEGFGQLPTVVLKEDLKSAVTREIEQIIKHLEMAVQKEKQERIVSIKEDIDSQRSDAVIVIEKRIKYREERLEDPNIACKMHLEDEIESLCCQGVSIIDKRIEYYQLTRGSASVPFVTLEAKINSLQSEVVYQGCIRSRVKLVMKQIKYRKEKLASAETLRLEQTVIATLKTEIESLNRESTCRIEAQEKMLKDFQNILEGTIKLKNDTKSDELKSDITRILTITVTDGGQSVKEQIDSTIKPAMVKLIEDLSPKGQNQFTFKDQIDSLKAAVIEEIDKRAGLSEIQEINTYVINVFEAKVKELEVMLSYLQEKIATLQEQINSLRRAITS